MPPVAKLFVLLGCLFALAAVVIGAFGAHGLKARLTPDLLAVYQTGVQYHFYHALGLILVGLLLQHLPQSVALRVAGWSMAAGIVFFSGSLYLLALSGQKWLGAVAPIGGSAFIFAWAAAAWAVWRTP
jgi:uncharacterized membrane protein YgdD (TMEM256/DUF423 family)